MKKLLLNVPGTTPSSWFADNTLKWDVYNWQFRLLIHLVNSAVDLFFIYSYQYLYFNKKALQF